ncbi:hypothetical protein FA15DRAFT_655669 [Coprinopsis marcescibilis]|uniref:Uncharacterized protein n=1 Tax=Coprinopsis marcescibilis TaxID=230819 RepID=A0A5C3KWS2_COPMA|nr:hypothetical protein FA15DRAFT_655669 [Coprinopsis marcescibilis]
MDVGSLSPAMLEDMVWYGRLYNVGLPAMQFEGGWLIMIVLYPLFILYLSSIGPSNASRGSVVAVSAALVADHIHTFPREVLDPSCGFALRLPLSVADEDPSSKIRRANLDGAQFLPDATEEVYALAKRQRFVVIWLALQYFGSLAVQIGIEARAVSNMKFFVIRESPAPTCILVFSEPYLVGIAFGAAALHELVLMALALYFARKYYTTKGNSLLQIILANGIVYWSVTFAFTLSTAILLPTGPADPSKHLRLAYTELYHDDVASSPVSALHSILPTRGVLALRASRHPAYQGGVFSRSHGGDDLPPMKFAQRPVRFGTDYHNGGNTSRGLGSMVETNEEYEMKDTA